MDCRWTRITQLSVGRGDQWKFSTDNVQVTEGRPGKPGADPSAHREVVRRPPVGVHKIEFLGRKKGHGRLDFELSHINFEGDWGAAILANQASLVDSGQSTLACLFRLNFSVALGFLFISWIETWGSHTDVPGIEVFSVPLGFHLVRGVRLDEMLFWFHVAPPGETAA